jgi:hypothetical protein
MIGEAGKSPQPQAEPPLPPVSADTCVDAPPEVGGRDGPDPVRYGDWEKNGRCIDF